MPRAYDLALQPQAGAARVARKVLQGWLAESGQEHLVEPVLLVTSELVTNAAVHARTAIEISLVAGDRSIVLTVRDYERRLPHPPTRTHPIIRTASWDSSGRGLVIVDALTDEWGVTELADGKEIWARWTHRLAGGRTG